MSSGRTSVVGLAGAGRAARTAWSRALAPAGRGRGAGDPWDLPGAAVTGVLALSFAAVAPPGRTGLDLGGHLLVAAGALALVARRRAPVAVLLVCTVSMVAYQMLGYPGVGPGLPVLVALFTAVQAGHRRIATMVTVIALVKGTVATVVMSTADEPVRDVLENRFLMAGWLIASGVMGEVARKQRAYLAQVEQRAAEAERSREEVALRRAGEERLRIARELHDSLTHSISVVKVQAGVAVHLARKRGEPVPEALLAIQEAGDDAARELRATLGVLRDDLDVEATPSLERLPDLLATARLAGVPASVTVDGDRRPLPQEVDRAAYRIVQEALTNVTRHAGPARASVQLGYGQRELTVQVDDDGRATPGSAPDPGVGLRGMRERVAALGGRLVARPRDGGGFTVRAELPLRRASSAVEVP